MKKSVVVAVAVAVVVGAGLAGWAFAGRKVVPSAGAQVRPASVAERWPVRRKLDHVKVDPRTPDEIAREHDMKAAADREDRCRPRDDLPREAIASPDPSDRPLFRKAVLAGRWDEARWYLYIGVPVPADLTPAQRRRLGREEISLRLYGPARSGDANEIRRLLRLGADPNVWIELDDIATPLATAAACNRVEAARALLDGGAQVDQRFWWGHGHSFKDSTALLFATMRGSTETVQLLVERGADVNAVTIVTDRWDERVRWELLPLDLAETRDARDFLRSRGAQGNPPGYTGAVAHAASRNLSPSLHSPPTGGLRRP